jgi:hypothetical protein
MLNLVLYGNSVLFWLISLGIAILTYILLKIFLRLASQRLKNMVTKTNTSVDDLIWNIINNSKNIFLLILSIYIGSKFLKLPQNVNQIMNVIMIITLWLQVGIWAAAAFKFWFMERNIDQADGRQKTNLSIINTIVRFLSGV